MNHPRLLSQTVLMTSFQMMTLISLKISQFFDMSHPRQSDINQNIARSSFPAKSSLCLRGNLSRFKLPWKQVSERQKSLRNGLSSNLSAAMYSSEMVCYASLLNGCANLQAGYPRKTDCELSSPMEPKVTPWLRHSGKP